MPIQDYLNANLTGVTVIIKNLEQTEGMWCIEFADSTVLNAAQETQVRNAIDALYKSKFTS